MTGPALTRTNHRYPAPRPRTHWGAGPGGGPGSGGYLVTTSLTVPEADLAKSALPR
jgi:hypothetical protein